MGESPVNELNDNATVTSSKDDTLSFEQQHGVTRIEALCRSRVPALIPPVLTSYCRPRIRKRMEVLGTLGVSLVGIGEGRRSSFRIQDHHAGLLCILPFLQHVIYL
jgi:hypothetical protein